MKLEYKGMKLKPYQVDDCIYALISKSHVHGFYQSSHDALDTWFDCEDDPDIVAIPFTPVSDKERDTLIKALEYHGINNDYFAYTPESIKSIDSYVIKPKRKAKDIFQDIIQTMLIIIWGVVFIGGLVYCIYKDILVPLWGMFS